MDSPIGKLISFLIEHIYVVVVVLGFLYTIFFRKSPIEKRPPNRMPDFGGGSPLGIPGRRAKEQRGPTTGPVARHDGRARPADGQPQDVPASDRTLGERPQRENLPTRERIPTDRSQPEILPAPEHIPTERSKPHTYVASSDTYAGSPRTYAASDSDVIGSGSAGFEESSAPGDNSSRLTGKHGLTPARDELARAIVWAEVLGPPRAKKPFRR